ncbi:MAG TPA: HAD family phosphatase [Propionicimonas sp.]|nr:HAD family phosphatase [Propionicimonas sp.]
MRMPEDLVAERDGALGLQRPAAIVFDCDGLLVDTEPCWTVAESAVFAARGLPYGPAEKALFIGKSVPATVELMAGFFGEVGNDEAICAEVMSTVGDVIDGQAEPMPGALELVRALSGRMPIGVASNSPRRILDITLRRAGLTGVFGAVIAADEVPIPKPAPDLYLAACRLLDADPLASIAFEDTWTGAAAARAAGMRVVGVPSLDPDGFPAELVLETLADPRLLAWAQSL